MKSIWVIYFHDRVLTEDGAFKTEQDCLDYMKAKGYTSMFAGAEELILN